AATAAPVVGTVGTRRGGTGRPGRGVCRWWCHPQRVPAVPAVLAAEVVKFFFPSLVELHSFVPTSSTAQKVANWGHLNRKVLSKLNFRIPEEMIQQLVQSRPGMAEQLLQLLREKIQERQRQRKGENGKARLGWTWIHLG
ncbi:PREDICTED: sperm flagellar protein 1, partial [Corvus brachyrhynchos]|uniref:sperm flagellar protein 1 n=1 Tax=Corvus brachyrhynchos TaxID=85066 RepID=UPI0008164EB8